VCLGSRKAVRGADSLTGKKAERKREGSGEGEYHKMEEMRRGIGADVGRVENRK